MKKAAKKSKANPFEDYIYETIQTALSKPLPDPAKTIYALSFFIYDHDDIPELPTLTFGYNTEQQVKENLKSASSPEEARWNYAFWIQNEIVTIGPQVAQENKTPNKTYAKLNTDWQKNLDADYPMAEFVAICIRVVRKLHKQGVIKAALGRPVPVLIHELEYNEDTADQTEAANPPKLATDFVDWVRGM